MEMNVKQVKEHWTLEGLLAKLGCFPDPKKSKPHDLWYCSPFRNESIPSMHVNPNQDIWMDFGLAEKQSGGDLIYFAQRYLESQGKANSVSDALRWFSEISTVDFTPNSIQRPTRAPKPKPEQFKLLSVKPIFTQALLEYLGKRKISEEVGHKYLRQVYFQHTGTGRKTFGLGMENEKGGYEIRNPLGFKGVVGSKAITTLFSEAVTDRVAVFEGMFDFLSWVCLNQRNGCELSDAIIMHTNRLYERTAEVIQKRKYKAVDLWLDNDQGGRDGFEALERSISPEMQIIDHSDIYKGCKDLGKWWEFD